MLNTCFSEVYRTIKNASSIESRTRQSSEHEHESRHAPHTISSFPQAEATVLHVTSHLVVSVEFLLQCGQRNKTDNKEIQATPSTAFTLSFTSDTIQPPRKIRGAFLSDGRGRKHRNDGMHACLLRYTARPLQPHCFCCCGWKGKIDVSRGGRIEQLSYRSIRTGSSSC